MNAKNVSLSVFGLSLLFAPSARASWQWSEVGAGADAQSIAASLTGGVVVVGHDNNIWKNTTSGFAQQTTDGSVTLITGAQSVADFRVLNTSSQPGNWTGVFHQNPTYEKDGTVGKEIADDPTNSPYLQGEDDALWKWNGSKWVSLGGAVHQITVWDFGTTGNSVPFPMVLGNDSNIWEFGPFGAAAFSPSPGTATLLADHVALLSTGNFSFYSNTLKTWTVIAPPPSGVPASSIKQIAAVYQIGEAPVEGKFTANDVLEAIWFLDGAGNIYEGSDISPPPK